MERNTQTHLGYPYNLQPLYSDLRPFTDFFLNNLGDAYAGSNYGINTQDLEREVINVFADMWGASQQSDPIWGAVTSCGTEGNLLGVLYGREAVEAGGNCRGTVVSSVESHYSIAKAARMYRMPFERVASTANDAELDYVAFAEVCRRISGEGGGVVAVVNAGSTVRGAHDRLEKVLEGLEAAGVPEARRYIHVDAALSGLILPLLEEARPWHFGFDLGADSIAVSGHKQLGTPLPCGVVCTKRAHMERWAAGTPAEADYVNTQDSTLAGSRSGFAALALWYAIEVQGLAGVELDARGCVDRAKYLVKTLNHEVPGSNAVRFNPFSTTVVFKRPCEALEHKFQLATTGDIAHVVVMPSVTKQTLNTFVQEYAAQFEK